MTTMSEKTIKSKYWIKQLNAIEKRFIGSAIHNLK